MFALPIKESLVKGKEVNGEPERNVRLLSPKESSESDSCNLGTGINCGKGEMDDRYQFMIYVAREINSIDRKDVIRYSIK